MKTSQSLSRDLRRAAAPMLTVAALFIVVACGGSGGGSAGPALTTASATNGSATNGSATNTTGATGTNTTGTATNGGATTGSSTPTWKSFTPAVGPVALNDAGNYLAYTNSGNTEVYAPSFTATASSFVTISPPAGLGYVGLDSVNSLGQIVGGAFANDSLDSTPYYWSSASATPVELALPTGVQYAFPATISKGGVIVCRAINSTNTTDYYVYPSPTSKPIKIVNSVENQTTVTISDAGIVVINGAPTATQALMFQSPYTGKPTTIASPSGSTSLGGAAIGPDGTVIGNDGTGGFYMLPNQYTKPKYIGTNYFILAVNSKEHMCGFHNGGGGNDNVAIWWPSPTGDPVTVQLKGAAQYTFASQILDDDSLIVGDDYGNYYDLLASASTAARPKR